MANLFLLLFPVGIMLEIVYHVLAVRNNTLPLDSLTVMHLTSVTAARFISFIITDINMFFMSLLLFHLFAQQLWIIAVSIIVFSSALIVVLLGWNSERRLLSSQVASSTYR